MAVFCIIISPMFKQATLKKAILQTLQIGRAVRLVWKAAPGWTAINGLVVLAQGLLPLAALFIIRQIVDTVTVGAQLEQKAPVFKELTWWLLLATGVGLLTALARSIGELASQAQSNLVTDYISDLLHAQSIIVDLAYYEDSRYYDTLHRAQAEAPYRPTSIVNGLVSLTQNFNIPDRCYWSFLSIQPASIDCDGPGCPPWSLCPHELCTQVISFRRRTGKN